MDSPVHLTENPSTSTRLSRLLPSGFVGCRPPLPTLGFFFLSFFPLMDFRSRFSRKAELLASFLTRLPHPSPHSQGLVHRAAVGTSCPEQEPLWAFPEGQGLMGSGVEVA